MPGRGECDRRRRLVEPHGGDALTARGKDQREIPTSRHRLAPDESSPDETTDLSLPGVGRLPSPWQLNSLGIALLALLLLFVVLSIGLAVRLSRTRADLAEAEAAAETAAAAVAREPAAPAAEAAEPAPPPAAAADRENVEAPSAQAAPPVNERLLLLLTVGTRHFAEKQLRRLRARCPARLAVYAQIRGRCAYSRCFAIAAPATDAGLSRCGQVKGQALRDRTDFVPQ